MVVGSVRSVVLFARGGGSRGLGNLVRSAALGRAFADAGWHVVPFFCVDDTSLDAVPSFGLCVERLDSRDKLWNALKRNFCSTGERVFVSDDVDFTAAEVRRVRAEGFRIVASLNDGAKGRSECDVLIDENAFAVPRPLPEGFMGRALIGVRYRIIRPDVRKVRLPTPWTKGRVESVLVSFGGSDPGNVTTEFVYAMDRASCLAGRRWTVVLGPFFNESCRKDFLKMYGERVAVVDKPPSLAQRMLEHDLLICMGGALAYEAMCVGIPCAGVRWGNLAPYVEGLGQSGLIHDLGCLPAAAESLKDLLGRPDVLESKASSAWRSVDGLGADRVVREFSEPHNAVVQAG